MNTIGTGFAAVVTLTALPLFAGSQVTATKAALATSSPVATQIAVRVLQNGGNAADAAVAAGFALGVVQPHATGLGGGGFLIYYDAKTKGIWTLDFRESAPAAAKSDMFASRSARVGPIAAGVPGTVAGLGALHERFGSQPWHALLAPAIALARGGVKVDTDVGAALLAAKGDRNIDQFKPTAALFAPDGKLLAPGATLVQSELAATLDRLAQRGARDFYEGEHARRFVDAVHAGGGVLTDRDLSTYAAIWRAPIRIAFRGFAICMPPPPATGAFLVAEALNILSGYELDASARTLHLIAEAARRAAFDRDRYLGDPDQVRIPWKELLSDDRARLWRATINPARVTPNAALAEPATTPAPESPHTTHYSIVDREGNAAAVTLTLDDDFGGGYVIPGFGFVMNDAMHDFTASPSNSIAPKRRPASSISPVIVLKNDLPVLVAGTPGGATMPTTMLQLILRTIVFDQPVVDAVAAPRFHQDAAAEDLLYERERTPRDIVDKLIAMGHGVRETESIGNVAAVAIEKGRMVAVADPRRIGAAGGY